MNRMFPAWLPGKLAAALTACAVCALLGTAAIAWADDGASVLTTKPSAANPSAKAGSSASLPDGVYTIASSLNGNLMLDVPAASREDSVQVQLYADNVTAAQRWYLKSNAKGLYTITNVNSGKSLDVHAGIASNKRRVQQYAANGTGAQLWKIEANSDGSCVIRSAVDESYVLDVPAARAANGSKIQLYRANGTAAQSFRFNAVKQVVSNGYYVISNRGSGHALDVRGASFEDAANVQQYTKNGTLAQTFKATYNKSNGYYTFLNVGSGKALDVAGASKASGANVHQYAPNNTYAQYWDVKKNSDGSFTVRSATAGNALDVRGASSYAGANVQVYEANGTVAQKWSFASRSNWLPEGAYRFYSSCVHGNAMAVANGSVEEYANIQTQKAGAANDQRFYLRSAGGGYYTIQNTHSGKYVDASSSISGSNVRQSNTAEKWKPELTSNGIVFRLQENPNVVLDLAGASTRVGANIKVYKSNGTLAQKWLLYPVDVLANGTYTIASFVDSNYVLDIPAASKSNGAVLQVYSSNLSDAQLFSLKANAAGAYQIVNKGSGKALEAQGSTVVQQTASSKASQQWRARVNANGSISFVSGANGSNKLTLNGAAANKTKVTSQASGGKNAQGWVLRSSVDMGSVTYDDLSITINQMASIEGVSTSYLDPAHLSKYQFLDLSKYSGTSAEDLDKALQSIAPWIGPGNPLYKSGQYFVEAAQRYGLNEVFLMIHAGQETGWGASAYFNGYYNFYGVDGGAGTGSAAASNAASRGWTSIEKGIVGGAEYLADEWVYRSNYPQKSPYALRYDYNYVNKERAYSYHHYTTANQWLTITADHLAEAYGYTNTGKNASFVYPRYK